MRIIPVGSEDVLPFDRCDLDALLTDGFAQGTSSIPRAADNLRRFTTGLADVAIRWEVGGKEPGRHYRLPSDTDDLVEYIERSYEPQLGRLHRFGIMALPHHTYVVEEPGLEVPLIYTITPFKPGLEPLHDESKPQAWKQDSNTATRLPRLMDTVRTYYANFDPSSPQIYDIYSPCQYASPAEQGDDTLAVLFDLDHGVVNRDLYDRVVRYLQMYFLPQAIAQ